MKPGHVSLSDVCWSTFSDAEEVTQSQGSQLVLHNGRITRLGRCMLFFKGLPSPGGMMAPL